jgi:hypothetical protein
MPQRVGNVPHGHSQAPWRQIIPQSYPRSRRGPPGFSGPLSLETCEGTVVCCAS